MKKNYSLIIYFIIFLTIFGADRITKSCALHYVQGLYTVNSWLSFDLVMNRGISWSLFHSTNDWIFIVLSACVGSIIGLLTMYTIQRYHASYCIIGEVLVLAGALSNFIDRIVYGGVIDFIIVSWDSWSWPVFNIADAAIVIGIGAMAYVWYGGVHDQIR